MVVLDTTVWVDYLRGTANLQTEWFERSLTRITFGLTDLILCEVLQGIKGERAFQEAQLELGRFQIVNTGGTNLAVASARNYRLLRERGRTVRKTIDCLIATFCLQEGFSLLHRDRDFDAFEEHLGLQVVHPVKH